MTTLIDSGAWMFVGGQFHEPENVEIDSAVPAARTLRDCHPDFGVHR